MVIRRFEFIYGLPGYQAPVLLDDTPGKKSCQLAPVVAGQGKVQATLSSREDVEGNSADWVDWPAGLVSQTTQDAPDGCTALRVYLASGTMKFIVRAE
jgi:hypothetical protein